MNGQRARKIRRVARENVEFFPQYTARSLARRLRKNAKTRKYDHVPLGLDV